MNLTEESKNIIRRIANKDIKCLYDMVFHEIEHSTSKLEVDRSFQAKSGTLKGSLQLQRNKEILVINNESSYEKLFLFISIWHILEEENLILSIDTTFQKTLTNASILFRYNDTEVVHDNNLGTMLYDYLAREIIILPKLAGFIERDFLTDHEFELSEERKLAESNMKFAKHNAKQGFWIAVMIAVITAVISSVVSYKMTLLSMSNESIVVLKNEESLVKQLRLENQKIIDSVKTTGDDIELLIGEIRLLIDINNNDRLCS